MPKDGYKAFTVKEAIFNKYHNLYQKRKNEFKAQRISFATFVTSMMEEAMLKHEAFARQAPFLEKLAVEQDRVIVKDNKRNRIAEVVIRNGELQCLLDERTDCTHIGFVYALPEIYEVMERKGIKKNQAPRERHI
jgi:hypothetical protein